MTDNSLPPSDGPGALGVGIGLACSREQAYLDPAAGRHTSRSPSAPGRPLLIIAEDIEGEALATPVDNNFPSSLGNAYTVFGSNPQSVISDRNTGMVRGNRLYVGNLSYDVSRGGMGFRWRSQEPADVEYVPYLGDVILEIPAAASTEFIEVYRFEAAGDVGTRVEYVPYLGDVILEIPAAATSDVWTLGNFAYTGTFNVSVNQGARRNLAPGDRVALANAFSRPSLDSYTGPLDRGSADIEYVPFLGDVILEWTPGVTLSGIPAQAQANAESVAAFKVKMYCD